MNKCKSCNRQFSKRHKVTDICLKCNHLLKKGRKIAPIDVMYTTKQKVVQKVSENPLLAWLEGGL